MKLVILDEKKQHNIKLSDHAKQRGHKVVSCFGTNDFFDAIQDTSPDRLLIDVSSWNNNSVVSKYFDFTSKITDIPVVFYNSPENFTQATGREGCDADVYLVTGSQAEEIVEAV